MNSNPNLPNLFKVSDDLYRGAQPTRQGFVQLLDLGILSIINLRSFHTDRLWIMGLGFQYFSIPCEAWHPEPEDVDKFLDIMKAHAYKGEKQNLPAFVHCKHGADRTGTMVAVYRIFFQGWDLDKAIDEMVNGPFGFHEIWEPFLKPFLEKYEKGGV